MFKRIFLPLFILGIGFWIFTLVVTDKSPTPSLAQDGGQDNEERETITLPISLYVLVDDLENPDPVWSSDRSEDELSEIVVGMNEIWSQADIAFEATITTVTIPQNILRDIFIGDFRSFFNEAGSSFILPDLALINGFYVKEIGGANGIVPFGASLFFVMDEPTVFDHRVSSHEIGHILGLYHVVADQEHLLSSGVNGMELSEEEQIVARYMARGFLEGLRQ